MICPSCAHENRTGAKFCEKCGAPLKRACASCGSELRPTAKFCDECGAPVEGAAAAPRSAEPTGARKVVTIIFADLVGSTALHERLDAEAVRQFMESYYVAMRGAVETHGGRVTQLMGDGVKAVFGAPRVAEDDAIRAVRAAVEMQRAFAALAEQQRGRVGKTGLRVAVNTGEVVAEEGQEIIGDPVNVAARLQEQGNDGDVVIGGSTQRLVATLVTLELLGTFALKGRSEAVKAYRVVSLERPAGAATAPFVGRDEELARLNAVYETAVEKPAAALAVLVGSPGLGKSRLIDEFSRRSRETSTVVRAYCEAAGGATFAPLAVALRELLGIEADATSESLRASVEAALPGDDADRARIAGGIAALLSGSPASPEETFFVVRRMFTALAQRQPVVFVIDDLQWAEPLLLDLVEHLVQWGSGVPMLVLIGARPELRDLRSSLVTPGGLVAEVVTLAGLDAGAAMRLAANVIGAADLPAAVAAKVLATSEGNPLFVGELVRMLVQEGALTKEGERWTIGAGLDALEMPPTIHALLASRIERLRPEECEVLERAAVVGRHFSRNAVAALLPGPGGGLDSHLEALRRSELIEPDTGWQLGEPVLRFHHVLIRDAAYRRLLKGTRAELHARLADWIVTRVGDAAEHDETIGWHLEQAHLLLLELGPIDAGGRALGERASTHLAAAGRRALERDDLPLAASLLGRAIDRLDAGDPVRADLALDWCEALLAAGDVGTAVAAIDELGRFIADSDRLRAWHTCFAGQLTVLTAPEELQATAETVAAAATSLAGLGDAAGEAKAHFVYALALSRLGRVGACEAALDQALAAARRADDRRRANTVLAIAPLAALWGPSPVTRASGRCLDVVRVLRITQGAPAVEAVALSCQGVLEALRGRTDAARRMIGSARKMVEELGITQRLLEVDVLGGLVALMEDDAPGAERMLHGAYDGLRDLGLGIDAARAAALLARALLAQDRVAEAEALSHESEALAGDDLKAAIAWRGVRAEAHGKRGEHTSAIELAQAGVAIAAATDALLDHAGARMALATALRAAGRSGEADAEQRRAVELWEAKGATLLAEGAFRDEAPVAPQADASGPRGEPLRATRRRLRPNAATELMARLEAAFAARDLAAIGAMLSENLETVDHPTGSTYGREGQLDSSKRMLRMPDLSVRLENLATLGESFCLSSRVVAARGTTGGHFDVADYQMEHITVNELDDIGRFRHIELFAPNHLGDALARLYERYAGSTRAGPERDRATGIARSVAALCRPFDVDRFAEGIAPDLVCVDHRHVALEPSRGAEAWLRGLRSLHEVADDISNRIEDILALRPDAILGRFCNTGTDRTGGGPFERQFLWLGCFGPDGLLARLELFEAEHEAEALARFDEVATGAVEPAVQRRVRANRATAAVERIATAIAERDLEAMEAFSSDDFVYQHHATGVSFGLREQLLTWRSAFSAEQLAYRYELVATLGESLVLGREWAAVSGLKEHHLENFGPAEIHDFFIVEADEQARFRRMEIFSPDHLGDAIARLYARYSEPLPAGPKRERGVTTARAVAMMLTKSRDHAVEDVVAPDMQSVDHRLVGHESLGGPEYFSRWSDSWDELAGERTVRVEDVLALSTEALLRRSTTSGVLRASGGEFEISRWALSVFGSDGRQTRVEYFEVGQEAEALARFDELTAALARPRPARRVRANAATRHSERHEAAIAAHDADALMATLSRDLAVIYHPTGTTYGAPELVKTWRGLFKASRMQCRHTPVGSLGESLVLIHVSISHAGIELKDVATLGPMENDHFLLTEVDEDERAVRAECFAEDHLGEALIRLYECYTERRPLGAERARAAATALAFARFGFLESFDLDRFVLSWSPAIEVIDHRILGTWSARGAGALREHFVSMLELVDDVALRIDSALGLRPDAYLVSLTHSGTNRDGGGAYERSFLFLGVAGSDGLVARGEYFDVGCESEAFARFDEVRESENPREGEVPAEPLRSSSLSMTPQEARPSGGDSASAWRFTNAATRSMGRQGAFVRVRDWQGVADLLQIAFRFSDRRGIAQLELDRDQYVSFIRQVDMASAKLDIEVIATRGDRLALARVNFEVAGGDVGPSEIEHLDVSEVDERGKCIAQVRFDPDDLDAAYAELDTRWKAGEGAAYSSLRTVWEAAIDRGDWDALGAVSAQGLVIHDNRLVGYGTLHGEEAWHEIPRVMMKLAPDARLRTDHEISSGRGILSTGAWVGTRDGGAFESPFVGVTELDEHDRVLRFDFYDSHHFDQARARFDEIATGTASAPSLPARFTNAATRALDRGTAALAARDWEGFCALFAPGFRNSDRRAMFLIESDREQWLSSLRQIIEMTSSPPPYDVLATRGDRLAMVRMLWHGADGDIGPSEIDWLLVVEVDERGDHVAVVTFDPDDVDTAYAELETRWEAGEGAADARAAGFLRNHWAALDRRDWDAVAALYSPTFVGRDHRLVSWGTLRGPPAFLEAQRAMVDLAPDVRMQMNHIRMVGGGLLASNSWVGTRDGGAFESPHIGVWELDAQRKSVRVDLYDPERLDAALARFEEIATTVPPGRGTSPPAAVAKPNTASTLMDRWLATFQASVESGDWDPMRALCTPGLVFEDRQRLSRVSGDRELMISSLHERVVAGGRPENSVLGTAGDRIAVFRSLWTGGPAGGRFEIEYLALMEVDESGLYTTIILCDLDDARAAQREAWARWAAIDPAAAAVATPMGELVDAFNAHDRERWRAQLADEIVVEDHRHASMGRIEGADAYTDTLAALWELAPETSVEAGWHWPAIDHRNAITYVRRTGIVPDGGEFESDYLNLYTVERGRITRMELFEVDAVDAALARFDEKKRG